MSESYSPFEGVVADVRELPFDAGIFDVALDKGEPPPLCVLCGADSLRGTMDAMMTAKGDVWVTTTDVVRTPLLKPAHLRTHQGR